MYEMSTLILKISTLQLKNRFTKMWQVWQIWQKNVTSVTKFDKCDKMWNLWKIVTNVTRKSDTKVWQKRHQSKANIPIFDHFCRVFRSHHFISIWGLLSMLTPNFLSFGVYGTMHRVIVTCNVCTLCLFHQWYW